MGRRAGMRRAATNLMSSRLAGMLGRSFWGLADQALVSLTSFLTLVLLARVLTPERYGAFVLFYGALNFFNALQSGLFTQPHNVLGSSRSGEDYARYTSTTFLMQFLFSVLLALLAAAGYVVGRMMGWATADLFLAMTPAILAWQVQEYLRRVYYTEGRVRAAFLNDLIGYGGQIVLVIAVWRLDRLNGPVAIYLLALTSALAAFVGLYHLRAELAARLEGASVRENWHFGKWLFGASLVQSGRIQAHVWLIGGLVSVTAAGLYRAAQNLVAPTHIMMNAVRSVAMPRAAAIYEREGEAAMRAYLWRMTWLGLAPIVLYLIAVCAVAEPLLHWLYAGQYDGYAWLVYVFAVIYLLAYLGQILTVALSAMRVTRAVLFAEVVTIVVAVGAGAPLIAVLGIRGAMATDVIVGATLLAALLRLRQLPRPRRTPAPLVSFVPVEVRQHGD